MSDERRIDRRFDITELIFVSGNEGTRAGLLVDISSTGCQVDFTGPLGRDPHVFSEADDVQLIIDGMGEIPGSVRRVTDKGLAVKFNIDDQQQEMLVAEIEAVFAEA